jgi:hypothetical protein
MNTALRHSVVVNLRKTESRPLWDTFISWCKSQEENRFLWLSVGVAGQGCLLAPMTLLVVVFTGNSMFLWALVIAAMSMTLITNLAAMPTKITLPVLFLGVLIDLVVIVSSIIIPLAIANP